MKTDAIKKLLTASHRQRSMNTGPRPSLILNLKMGAESFPIKKTHLFERLLLFRCNPSLLGPDEYEVKTPVSPFVFSSFVEMVKGAPITVCRADFNDLRLLNEEFCFEALSAKLSEFEPKVSQPLTEAELLDLELSRMAPGHRVTITTENGSKTFVKLTSLSDIKDFASALSEVSEDGIAIDGIEEKDHIVERAVAVVYSNTVADLQSADAKEPFLALVLWVLHKWLYFICVDAVRYCMNRLHEIAPTGFDKEKLVLLSQCDLHCPGDFKPSPTADWAIIGEMVRKLKHESNGRSADARTLLRTLKDTGRYERLLVRWSDSGDSGNA
jgi:hypothetical protein